MSKETPFLLSKVECPICKTVNELETIKVGAYQENGRDTDFCPLGITWRYERYEAYNPLLFFAATCSHCLYTREFNKKFKDWKNDNNYRTYRLKTIKANHLEKMAPADSPIRELGSGIDPAQYPNESAILKLHLAVFDEQLAERPIDLDLGRFYLRIAWIYRFINYGENPVDQLVKGLVSELVSKYNALPSKLTPFKDELKKFSGHIDSHFVSENLSAQQKSELLPFKEKFEEAINEIVPSFESITTSLETIENLVNEYKEVAMGGEETFGGLGFKNHNSFTDFLTAIKQNWGGIVTTEHEALEKAVFHYKQAMEDSKSISAGNHQIQATYLIAELSRKIGDYDGARQYFNSTIKYGQEFVYKNRRDQSRTALARKILELAIEQGKLNLAASKKVSG